MENEIYSLNLENPKKIFRDYVGFVDLFKQSTVFGTLETYSRVSVEYIKLEPVPIDYCTQ